MHSPPDPLPLEIAVLVPCRNEAQAIAKVVGDFRRALPEATLYVYDNNSTDGSAERARAAGAAVRHEPRQGKGFVVRRMFADIEADVFVMVDGDDTYEAAAAPRMVRRMAAEGLDVVNGVRVPMALGAYQARACLRQPDAVVDGADPCSAMATATCCRAIASSRAGS
jgi:glycosyltransferase involved in cell wall biosynthesis